MKQFFKKIANAVKSAVETVVGAVKRFFSEGHPHKSRAHICNR